MSALAKLTRPKLHQVVQRERLFERLDRCRERPIAWVVGPPGAGKTTVVASYIGARRIGGLWYHIDGGDRDLATFFHYLSEAADAATRKRSAPLPRLGPEHRADLPGFARLYFRALFARLKAPAAVVLDNYHELPAECELHGLLDTLAAEIPEGACLAVISRSDPPPQCAALRAYDRIALLEWDELRLTFEETQRIAALRNVSDTELLRQAHALADGWPVGLTLTLERLKRFGSEAGDVREVGRDMLFTYFAGQIFNALPQATRDMLMRTALLPRATAQEAARVSANAEAGALLESLYRRRLFVDRRGDAFQFHDLFRAFLLQEFERAHAPPQRRELRARAVGVLQESGRIEDAFALACVIEDWDVAAMLVWTHAGQLFEQGRGSALRQWLAALPPQRVDANPWLGFWLAIAMSPVAPAQARERFARTFAQFTPDVPEHAMGRLSCCSGVITTHYLEMDSLATMDPWIDELLAMLEHPPRMPSPAAELRVYNALLFALSFRRPLRAQTAQCIAHMLRLLEQCPVSARIDAAALLMTHHSNCGDMEHAGRIARMAQPWSADAAVGPLYAALWWFHMGHYEFKCGHAAAARAAYQRSQAIMRDNAMNVPVLKVNCPVGLASVALTEGEVDAAQALVEGMSEHWNAARKIDLAMQAGFNVAFAAWRGDMSGALRLSRHQFELNDVVGIIWHRYFARIQLGFVLAELGQHDELAAVLAAARALVRGSCYEPLEYQVDLVDAYAALLHGAGAEVDAKVGYALRASRHDAGEFFPRMLPRMLPRLFAHALARGIETEHVRRCITTFGMLPPRADVIDWPWPLQIRTLGAFEVLRYGAPLEFSRKLPRKTLALLKALIALGGDKVAGQKLIDVFWSDEDGDVATRSLEATVLRLRTLLGEGAAVIQQGGKLSLDRRRVWVDASAFEQALSRAESAARAHEPHAREQWQRAFELYRGAFLSEDESEVWSVPMRERLRGRFIHALVAFAQQMEAAGEHADAITAYQRGIEADAAVEPFYQGLMRCYAKLDRRTEAIAAYRRLKQILSVTLGLAPAPATEKLYQSLR